MLPMLRREVVKQRQWLTDEELLNYYAIGQSTPGIIAVNTSTFIGYKRAGIPGAIIATAGMVTPSLIIITLIAAFCAQFQHVLLVAKAFQGIRVAVAMLLAFTVGGLLRKTVKSRTDGLLALTAFLALVLGGTSPISVIVSAALLGLLAGRWREKMT